MEDRKALPGKIQRSLRFRRAALACVPALAFATLLASCTHDLRMTATGLRRAGWDTLYVQPTVSGGTVDSVAVLVFAGRDTVLDGGARGAGPLLVRLPDAQLPSDSSFLVEVCAFAAQHAPACAQDALRSSPKRFRSRLDVTYPANGDPDRLAYTLAWRVERLRAHGDGYETLLGRTPGNARLRIAVDEAADAAALDVPLRYAAGTVALPGQRGYDGFWLALNDRFFYGDTARVRVELRAGSVALAADTLVLAPRSRAERVADVQALADAFARTLARYRAGTAPEATGVRWRYDRIQQHYVVELTAGWRDSTGSPKRLKGRLTVAADGGNARFDGKPPGDSAAPVLTYRFDRLAGFPTPSKTRPEDKTGSF